MDGKRPSRPIHPKLTDSLWELTERCWATSAEDRPEMEEVVEALKRMSVFLGLYEEPFSHILVGIPVKLPKPCCRQGGYTQ